MSISIVILKEIDGFSYEALLNSVQRAAINANMYCIHSETVKHFNRVMEAEIEYLSGTLSEVDAETLKSNFEKGIHTRQCGFSIQKPTEYSRNSFTWLINRGNYFGALELEYINGDFEFVYQFLSQYFKLGENIHDYLWIDDTDWFYSANDMIWLSTQPYDSAWSYKKLHA